ncbi:MAG TPA: hypothetical protein VF147_01665 [Vicinamibacterales bacterium]
MTNEQCAALYGLALSSSAAIALLRIRKNPSATRSGRLLMSLMESRWWSTRWSASPEARIDRMLVIAVFLALLMLGLLIAKVPLRY